jgi:ABC-type polysaccharide/polyol phosphate transport system ATPase subunit
MCDWLVWLDHGQIRQTGRCAEVIDAYTQHAQGTSTEALAKAA